MRRIDYRADIQKALDYVEEHLKEELTITMLARAAGYSEYHFLRVFKKALHLTPADYIRKRRLSEIVKRMEREKCPMSILALEYGFHSQENFIRAFKTEHRILPTEFQSTQNSLKLYDRPILVKEPFDAKAEILHLESFRLAVYPSDESFPPQFWNRYNVKKYSQKLSGGKSVLDYGVSDWDAVRRELHYYIGIREEDAMGDLSGTITLEIPGGMYAVFTTPPSTHFDFVNTIHRTWDYIGRVWLKENGFRRTGGYEFETYLEESRSFSQRIYIPIVQEEEEE